MLTDMGNEADVAPVTPGEAAGLGPSINAVVATLFTIVGVLIGLVALNDNSFLTHLATGRLILDQGAIPGTDPYSFTAPGAAWTVQSWGASVIYAGIEDIAGLAGVRALMGLLCGALALGTWRLTRSADTLLGRILAAMLVVGIGAGAWTERPLLFGLLGIVAVLAAVDGDLDPRWLLPIMWLWVNTHGSFPLGLGAIGLFMIGHRLDREKPEVEIRALGWALAGTALAAINPLGPKLLVFPLGLVSNRESFAGIDEWGPMSFASLGEWLFAVELGLALVVWLTRGRQWRIGLPLLVFGAAALMSVRNVAPASLVILPGLAYGLRGLGTLDGRVRPAIARPALVALVALGCLAATFSLATGPDTDLAGYPEASVTWMRDEGLLDVEARVISRDYVGNYLEARFGPEEVRVFFDDRVDMYPIEVIRDYIALVRLEGDVGPVLDRHDPTAVLWERDTDLGRWIEDTADWRVVHRDATWLVAVPA